MSSPSLADRYTCTEIGNDLRIETPDGAVLVDPYQGTVNRKSGSAWPGRNGRRIVAVSGRLNSDSFQFNRVFYEDGEHLEFNAYPRMLSVPA